MLTAKSQMLIRIHHKQLYSYSNYKKCGFFADKNNDNSKCVFSADRNNY